MGSRIDSIDSIALVRARMAASALTRSQGIGSRWSAFFVPFPRVKSGRVSSLVHLAPSLVLLLFCQRIPTHVHEQAALSDARRCARRGGARGHGAAAQRVPVSTVPAVALDLSLRSRTRVLAAGPWAT